MNKTKLKWTKSNKGLMCEHETRINGYRVSRVTCSSGVKHYYVHWYQTKQSPLVGATGWHMSEKLTSLRQVRIRVQYFLDQCTDKSPIYVRSAPVLKLIQCS